MRTAGLVLGGIVLAAVAQAESTRLVCSFETPADVQGIQGGRGKRAARGGACYRGAIRARSAV